MNKANSSNSAELFLYKPIEDVYSSEDAKELKNALKCYFDKDFGQAATYSKQLAVSRVDKKDQLYVLAEFFRLHLDAYDIWDGTYDYKRIKEQLRNSTALLINNKFLFIEDEWNYLTSLGKISRLVILGTAYENCMITSDTNRMIKVSTAMVREAERGIDAIKGAASYSKEGTFAHFICHQLEIKLKSQEATGQFAYLMNLKEEQPLRFLWEYSRGKKYIKERLDDLTSIPDFELASELRAHYFFLEKSYELVSDCVENGFIKLRNGEIHYFVGILVDERYAGDIYDRLSKKVDEDLCEISPLFARQKITIRCDVVEEDPSDLMAESYKIEGNKSMSWLTLKLDKVQIKLHRNEEEIDFEFELHYYKYGVCNLCLKIDLLDKEGYSPSKLMLLRSLIGPHMGQTKIKWQDNDYLYIAKEDGDDRKEANEPPVTLFRDVSDRLKIVFELLAEEVKKEKEEQGYSVGNNSFGIFGEIKKWQIAAKKKELEIAAKNIEKEKGCIIKENSFGILHQKRELEIAAKNIEKEKKEKFLWEYNPEMNWFSFIYIRSAVLKKIGHEEELIMDGSILKKAPEFKALLLDSREARATIDDWIGSKEPTTKNLSLIRSHKNDLLVVGENHATVYFPEDPEFVIFQYNESLEMLSNLRTITNTYNSIMNRMLRESKEVTQDISEKLQYGSKSEKKQALEEIKDHILKITNLKIQTEYMCNLTMTSTISQYRDHARLMSEMINTTTIPETLNSIRIRIGMISETEKSLDDIIDSIHTIEDARFNSYIGIIGTTIGIVALFGSVIQMLSYISNSEQSFWEMNPFTRIFLSVMIMVILFLFVLVILKFITDHADNRKKKAK